MVRTTHKEKSDRMSWTDPVAGYNWTLIQHLRSIPQGCGSADWVYPEFYLKKNGSGSDCHENLFWVHSNKILFYNFL